MPLYAPLPMRGRLRPPATVEAVRGPRSGKTFGQPFIDEELARLDCPGGLL